MTNQHFPGNPFSEGKRGSSLELEALVNALHLLAFEQRTANLIAAGTPIDQTHLSPDQLRRSRAVLTEARQRLGRPAVAYEEPKGQPRIVVILPDDPDLDPVGRADVGREILHAVEKAQGIYPVEIQ